MVMISAPKARPIPVYSSSASTIIIWSSVYRRSVGIISPALARTDFPEPGIPKITPEPVFRSLLRSTVMAFLES